MERQFSATTIESGKLTIGFDARASGLLVRGSIPKSAAPFIGSCPVPDPVELFASRAPSSNTRILLKSPSGSNE